MASMQEGALRPLEKVWKVRWGGAIENESEDEGEGDVK
jgi:hypothetical protein